MADLVITEKENLVNLANVIKEKAGLEDGMSFPDGFLEAIAGIENGGGNVEVQTFTPSGDGVISIEVSGSIGKAKSVIVVQTSPEPTSANATNTVKRALLCYAIRTGIGQTCGKITNYSYGGNVKHEVNCLYDKGINIEPQEKYPVTIGSAGIRARIGNYSYAFETGWTYAILIWYED